MTTEQPFDRRVTTNGASILADRCWEWTAGRFSKAGGIKTYGCFNAKGKSVYAHRVAWESAYGAIPRGQHVLHRCDNPVCVKPTHLFLGDHSANMKDKQRKGRAPKTRALLTKEIVAKIRMERRYYGWGPATARKYGVSVNTLYRAVYGYSWRDVT